MRNARYIRNKKKYQYCNSFLLFLFILLLSSFYMSINAFGNAVDFSFSNQNKEKDLTPSQTNRVEFTFSDTKANSDLFEIIKSYINKKEEKKGLWPSLLPTLIPLGIGALLTAIIPILNYFHQKKREKEQDQHNIKIEQVRSEYASSREIKLLEANSKREILLEEKRSKMQLARELLSLEQRRLEYFYAPLQALLQQSRGVTNRLCQYFLDKYRKDKWSEFEHDYEFDFMTPEEAAIGKHDVKYDENRASNQRLFVRTKKGWIKFRFLDFMPWLVSDSYCKSLVDQILQIGEKKVEIISKYAGLAAISGERPSPMFGEYLAHYSIIATIRKETPKSSIEPETQKVGYYPKDFDMEVMKGYDKVREDIKKWEQFVMQG